jgi:hypothetical protein
VWRFEATYLLRIRARLASMFALHLPAGWDAVAALEMACDQLGLALGDRHDRAKRLDQPDEVQPRDAGVREVPVERKLGGGRSLALGRATPWS